MGAPTTIQYHGTDVRFCCKDCEKEFQKDPDKYLKRLEQARQKAQQKAGE
jgi:YHS domain-containing protein